ncbi:MAG: hypothetical protein KY475_06385, partial [Planctomycetes bacterium]|nr:hypothetical protein [Planctomycetota bacterium]
LQCKHSSQRYTLIDLSHPPGQKSKKPTYDLLVRERSPEGQEVATGLTFIVTGSKTSATASLRRIYEDPSPPEHVIVVCDERQPLSCGKAGQQYWEKLSALGKDGFQVMQLTFSQYAQLDALEAAIGEARSGDLETVLPGVGMRQISEAEVIQSHHRNDRYRSHPLLCELLCEESAPTPPPPPPPPPFEIRQFIAAQLALTMGMSSVELAQKYHAKYEADGRPGVEETKVRLEQVALEMHHEELINATPMGDYLYLLNRPGR